MVAWGDNGSGQTHVPTGVTNAIAIAAGSQYNLALRSGGTVIAWGSGSQTNVPAGLSNVVALAAGFIHSLALQQNGTVVKWGDAFIPAGLSNVVAIATAVGSSHGHNVALKNDGTVAAWGWDTFHAQTNLPAGLSNVVTIAAGGFRSLAIKAKPRISSIESSGQNQLLHFGTFSGQQYTVEYSPDLAPGSWTELPGGSVPGDGYDATVVDTNALSGAQKRFYRTKASPP